MKISELVKDLVKIRSAQGDIDVAWLQNGQFVNIRSVFVSDARNCQTSFRWSFGNKVAVIDPDKS